jgi:hypothetical protein
MLSYLPRIACSPSSRILHSEWTLEQDGDTRGGCMRLPSLERLASGLWQAPHEYRPSLQVFPDVSVDAIARDLQVVESGKQNGALNLPSSTSENLDEAEYTIVERIFAQQGAGHHIVVDQLETYAQRLAALDFLGRFTVIQHAAPAAVSEFKAEAQQGRDLLYQLRRALLENENERDIFRKRNRLQRAPRLFELHRGLL